MAWLDVHCTGQIARGRRISEGSWAGKGLTEGPVSSSSKCANATSGDRERAAERRRRTSSAYNGGELLFSGPLSAARPLLPLTPMQPDTTGERPELPLVRRHNL
jgi:predicted dinucleotide-binding enzyme